MSDNIDANDIKKVYKELLEYVMKSRRNRPFFLPKEDGMIVLACLKYCIDKLEEEDGKAKKGL